MLTMVAMDGDATEIWSELFGRRYSEFEEALAVCGFIYNPQLSLTHF